MLPFRDFNPARNFPLVTISLLVLNTLVFLYTVSLAYGPGGEGALQQFYLRAAVIPYEIVTGRDLPPASLDPVWVTVLTAMFLHGGWLHLAGNMLYLWIFGNNVEDIMGSFRFLLFYLICGVLAFGAHVLSAPYSKVPTLGASGAIAGVLGAYLVRFPRAQVDSCLFLFIFVTVVRLPAILVLAFWFVLQLFQGTLSLIGNQGEAGGVAVWAHVGGFIAGMALVNLFARKPQSAPTW